MNEQHVAGSERLPPSGMPGHCQGSGGGGKGGDQEVQALPRIDTDPTVVGSANPCCLPFIGNDS